MMLRISLLLLTVLIIAPMACVRLAPADQALYVLPPGAVPPGDYPETGGFKAVRQITISPADILQAVRKVALDTPRTRVVAEDAATGQTTYETRSRFWGFPDYTTVAVIADGIAASQGPLLVIRGHLRFGSSDLGVNEARIRAWLAALGPQVAELS
jgi:uncharacterized protein (DUF1499 family)